MIKPGFNTKFALKIRDLNQDLGDLYKFDKKINNQYSTDIDCIPIVQKNFELIKIKTVLNYRNELSDNDFFFFRNNTLPISELSRLYLIYNVYNNLHLHIMCYVFYTDHVCQK